MIAISRVQEYTKAIAALVGIAAAEAVTLGLDKRYWWVGVIVGALGVLGVERSPKNKERGAATVDAVFGSLTSSAGVSATVASGGGAVADAGRTENATGEPTGDSPKAAESP